MPATLNPAPQAELGWTETAYGNIVTAFQAAAVATMAHAPAGGGLVATFVEDHA